MTGQGGATPGQEIPARTPHLAGQVGEERATREQGWGRRPLSDQWPLPGSWGLNLPSRAPSSTSPRQAALASDPSGSCSGGKAGPCPASLAPDASW